MISPEQHAEIRRLFYAEHWKVGTIAAALGVHHEAVELAIEKERFCCHVRVARESQLDRYAGFVEETLKQYPRIPATRVFEMLRVRGYPGKSAGHVRRLVQRLRPAGGGEAYLRLSALPGEEAQVDWGSFGKVRCGQTERPLSCFVMVLSYSRALFVHFTLDQTLESFLRGHVAAFTDFAGVPRVVLYDNLKSAVLERCGSAIRFHPRLLELCGHYHFAARACAPGRGNEKGRVERAIRYLRTSFFPARDFRDLEDLRRQFVGWRETVAHARPSPGGEGLSVAAALDRERAALLPLPAHPLETDLVRAVASGKTPYVRFDRNLYSVPHLLVRKPLTLMAGADEVRLYDRTELVARHRRSYEAGQVVEDPAHVAALVAAKRAAQPHSGRDRLTAEVPQLRGFFAVLAERGEALGCHTVRLLRLLDRYGPDELRTAVAAALARGAYTAGAVAHVLDIRRRERGQTPPVAVTLPDLPQVRELAINHHKLEDYDELA